MGYQLREESEMITASAGWKQVLDYVTPMAINQRCSTTCRTWEQRTQGPCLFLTTECSHVQLPLTYNQYDDLQHMSGTWLPSLMPPFWRKRKSSSTIDFSLVLRLVNYINNSQQQRQRRKIRWSSSSVSSVPFVSWHSARQVVIYLFFFVLLFPFSQPSCNFVAVSAWQCGSFTALPHCVSRQDGITA